MHRLGDDETEVVREAVRKPLKPVRAAIGMIEGGLEPDLAIAHLDRSGFVAKFVPTRTSVRRGAAISLPVGEIPS
jgi:hypothetical protein